jgi:hypothetical protein
MRAVRVVLHAEDFSPWPQIIESLPAWTPAQVAELERAAAGKSSPSTWLCRIGPLPRARWLAIETRTYTNKQWEPFDPDTQPFRFADAYLGVVIDGRSYLSKQVHGPGGASGYHAVAFEAGRG